MVGDQIEVPAVPRCTACLDSDVVFLGYEAIDWSLPCAWTPATPYEKRATYKTWYICENGAYGPCWWNPPNGCMAFTQLDCPEDTCHT